jgi:glycosyltransferase involved in cell wall biosynthesis
MGQIDMDRVLVAPEGDKYFNYDGPNSAQFTLGKVIGGAIRAPLAFRRMIRQSRADVVVSFLKGTNLLAWAALAGMVRGRPQWIAREGNNVLSVIDEESPNKLVAKASLWVTKKVYQAADVVLANSTDMKAGLTEDLGLKPDRVRMINNPIAIDTIRSQLDNTLPGAPNRPFILTAGRLENQKAHDVMIRAFARSGLWRTHALVILGKGSRLAALHTLAAKLGVGEYVRFIGFVANPYAWMARAELFLLSSRWEGFPTVAAEALAAGAPLVLSDCPFGPRDVIEPGVSGELVPVDDVDALADMLAALIADPARRAAMVKAGAARVKQFDIAPMIEQYGALFEELALRKERVIG